LRLSTGHGHGNFVVAVGVVVLAAPVADHDVIGTTKNGFTIGWNTVKKSKKVLKSPKKAEESPKESPKKSENSRKSKKVLKVLKKSLKRFFKSLKSPNKSK
jgi:hypothetical protein